MDRTLFLQNISCTVCKLYQAENITIQSYSMNFGNFYLEAFPPKILQWTSGTVFAAKVTTKHRANYNAVLRWLYIVYKIQSLCVQVYLGLLCTVTFCCTAASSKASNHWFCTVIYSPIFLVSISSVFLSLMEKFLRQAGSCGWGSISSATKAWTLNARARCVCIAWRNM